MLHRRAESSAASAHSKRGLATHVDRRPRRAGEIDQLLPAYDVMLGQVGGVVNDTRLASASSQRPDA